MNKNYSNKFIAILCAFGVSIVFYSSISYSQNILLYGSACLETTADNLAAKVYAKTCQDNSNQQFVISGNKIKLQANPDMCLSYLPSGKSNIIVWSCNEPGRFQQNFIISQGSIRLPSTNNNCLAINQDDQSITTKDCTRDNLDYVSYSQKLVLSGHCLELSSNQNGAVLIHNYCNGNVNQQFFVYQNTIRPVAELNKCLDTFDSGLSLDKPETINTAKIYLNNCNPDNEFQKFVVTNNKIQKLGFNNYCFKILNVSKFGVSKPVVLDKC